MLERIVILLIVAGIVGFVFVGFVLYCCIHASNFSDKEKLDDEQEKQLDHIRKEELS